MDASEQFIRAKYPFINQSTVLMPTIYQQADSYLPVSCLLVSRICHAGMQTTDGLLTSTTPVPVTLLLNDLWQMFWAGYVSFSQIANSTQGTNAITISSQSMSLLNVFAGWDEALQACPFSDIGQSFSALLQGVDP